MDETRLGSAHDCRCCRPRPRAQFSAAKTGATLARRTCLGNSMPCRSDARVRRSEADRTRPRRGNPQRTGTVLWSGCGHCRDKQLKSLIEKGGIGLA
ncbi:hypothetical protein RSPO_c00923 [Ralstonia solanacearum Po82]|uniref:Uncharacterized protein n=1 Tax=Ralstonia solanacearum (strain Po82) TaxID=1031711 RepID=F6FYZ1_RALS8|nr:hypothetical protein RSPO_c00923 [Ralstonia solanacearum Po82]